MLNFTQLKEDFSQIEKYLNSLSNTFCDLTKGVRFIWGKDFKVEYAIVENTLILKETALNYQNAFYYPIGENVEKALDEIENYCKEKNIPLVFCCINNETAVLLTNRYPNVYITNDRDWSDYIYSAKEFKSFTGKKYSGQRNHINKFNKLYPNYKIERITENNINKIINFIKTLNQESTSPSWTKKIEDENICHYLENMFSLEQFGIFISIENKVVAFSVGEKVNNTIYVHVEKALREYEGVYPTLANAFAKTFCTEEIEFINREEDCGDNGLRISKLQYHPIEIKQKNIVKVKTLIDKITNPIYIKTDRLEIADLTENDALRYFNLYLDEEVNKFWGYDYREDLGEKTPTPTWFYNFQKELKERGEEYSLAVKLNGNLIGELVLAYPTFYNGIEIGFRFFKEFHGCGYAKESASALINYVIENFKPLSFTAHCYKQNENSKKLIEKLGFKLINEDNTFYYFKLI